MILHINFLPEPRKGTATLVSDLLAVLEQSPPDPRTLARLRVHLDWIQYRQNFREAVIIRRAVDCRGAPSPLLELAIDARQTTPEIFILEIGVGTGERAAQWLDRFKQLDAERGSGFYPRLRFLLSDYSSRILDRAAHSVRGHQEISSFIALDALNPFKTLSFLRYKILHIHLTNVYDNLPNDEMVRKDGRFYQVEGRAYLSAAAAAAIAREFDLSAEDLGRTVGKFLEVGPDYFPDRTRGVQFWQAVWAALKLEERLVELEDLAAARLPSGLTPAHIEQCLSDAPVEVRFHLSTGAGGSFLNTVPLLHPRGYLQVQDIFVTD